MNIDIKLDSKAMRKLISVVSSGVGAVAAPWVTRPAARARARADEMRILAQGQADAEAILRGEKLIDAAGELVLVATQGNQLAINTRGEVQNRLEFQELKRQDNLQSIVRGAAENIGDAVSEEPVDEDWIASFFDLARDVSSASMQLLWSRILAGEVSSPGSFSLRTLDTLKKISKKEAEAFQKLDEVIITDFIFNDPAEIEKLTSINFDSLLNLSNAGLINMTFGLVIQVKNRSENGKFEGYTVDTRNFVVVFRGEDESAKYEIGAITLTEVGREILEVMDRKPVNWDFLRVIARDAKRNALEMFFVDGILKSDPQTKIEPAEARPDESKFDL